MSENETGNRDLHHHGHHGHHGDHGHHGEHPRDEQISIEVNDQCVQMPCGKTTGREIKQAAIAQGVSVKLDFILSELLGSSGKTQIVGDNDIVHLHEHSRFVAIAHDDNSDETNPVAPAVMAAIGEIKATFPEAAVSHTADGQGGAFVTIDPVDLGEPFAQQATWLGCHLTFQYPYADIYPLFVRPDLSRVDGKNLGQGFGQATFNGQPATQLSRRSNRRDPKVETAVMKVLKVLDWLKVRS